MVDSMLCVLNHNSKKYISCHVALIKLIHYWHLILLWNRIKYWHLRLLWNRVLLKPGVRAVNWRGVREPKTTSGFINDTPCVKYSYCTFGGFDQMLLLPSKKTLDVLSMNGVIFVKLQRLFTKKKTLRKKKYH